MEEWVEFNLQTYLREFAFLRTERVKACLCFHLIFKVLVNTFACVCVCVCIVYFVFITRWACVIKHGSHVFWYAIHVYICLYSYLLHYCVDSILTLAHTHTYTHIETLHFSFVVHFFFISLIACKWHANA